VVATVDGVAITVEEVERVANELEMEPLEALRRLEDEQILANRAQEQNYGEDPVVRFVVQRALGQATLEKLVEDAVTPADISPEERLARYEDRRGRYHRSEWRASRHLLAKVKEGGNEDAWNLAREFAVRVIAELEGVTEPASEFGRWSGVNTPAFAVRIETLPAVPRDGRYQKAFEDALFGPEAPGLIGEPARTTFGWHAIVLTRIEPEIHVSLEDAEEEVVRELVEERRAQKLSELLEELRLELGVQRNEQVIDRLLEDGIPALGGGDA